MSYGARSAMRRILFIVSPDRPDIYDGLRKVMQGDPNVEVIFERREGPRRRRPGPAPGPERRRTERRDSEREQIAADVRLHGWSVIRIET